jgi:hypothetical protein
MGKLILSRKKEWQNKARKFRIYIDGKKIDTIANGEIKEIEIEPGKHKLILKIDWCSSPEVDIEISEEKSTMMETSGYKLGNWVTLIMALLFGAFFTIKIFLDKDIEELVYLIIPFFLIILYYLTFGRKKYIVLKEM